ncbi:hypothetical protein bplSymb_SCF02601P014 [Bathymodiolus platifrons methanotrophic gill symbiont]|uniref:IS30 family transposase n=1 Tax=Bathymodiolus platifrons methanotrophic gill symbiont TaxID=113268 RepID=UPI000B415E69|nr:IS30 family transposase [Bathymodiolus platifrons methanotrophic gill symbiont]GAW86379.1 hypothetical protein bplSymb_SCF02601P014 [Bathymodiolus platifrons methanotrophic gill symbiont]
MKDRVGFEISKTIRIFAERLGCEVVELNVQEDHVHLLVMVPPKVAISQLVGTIKGALVTIVDRVSKFTLIKNVDSKQSKVVTEATIMILKPYLDKTHTITADNGKEFAGHEKLAEQLETKVYFAHPYASWERGLNENTNGLIRQYFVKGSRFEEISGEEVEAVMNKLNHRPRKTLNYDTPLMLCFFIRINVRPHDYRNCTSELNPP